MRLLITALLGAGLMLGAADSGPKPKQVLVFPGDDVIPHVVGGGPWTTSITLVNLGTVQANLNVWFYGDDGSDQNFTVEGIGSTSGVAVTLPVGNSITINTLGGPSIPEAQGWAQLELADPNAMTVGGMAVFKQVIEGRPDFEAVVSIDSSVLVDRMAFPFDDTGGFTTCYALVNPTDWFSTVYVTVRDEDANTIASGTLTFNGYTHQAFVLKEMFAATEGKRGTIEFYTPAAYMAGLGLRFNDTGAFTSFPGLTPIEWVLGETSASQVNPSTGATVTAATRNGAR